MKLTRPELISELRRREKCCMSQLADRMGMYRQALRQASDPNQKKVFHIDIALLQFCVKRGYTKLIEAFIRGGSKPSTYLNTKQKLPNHETIPVVRASHPRYRIRPFRIIRRPGKIYSIES